MCHLRNWRSLTAMPAISRGRPRYSDYACEMALLLSGAPEKCAKRIFRISPGGVARASLWHPAIATTVYTDRWCAGLSVC
jgi:hypothetical protein